MQSMAHKIWASAQQNLRAMLNADIYNLWFAPVQAVAIDTDVLTLEVANDFCEVWLKDNYLGLLRDVVGLASGRQLQIKFRVGSGNGALTAPAAPVALAKAKDDKDVEPITEKTALALE